ncbi:hypothetical protein ACJMK2_023081, partial [Sinanodonta woodiana]
AQSSSNGYSKKVQAQERRRTRVTKMVVAIVLLFAIFWLPIHVINLWLKLDKNFPRTTFMYGVKIFAHSLSYANSCVNPFVYAFLSDEFRKSFRKSFPQLAQKLHLCTNAVDDEVKSGGYTEYTRMVLTQEGKHLMETDL